MKKIILAIVLIIAMSVPALAATTTGRSTATGKMPVAVIATEICVFCHTPRFDKTDTAPLWNRGTLATGYVYGMTVKAGSRLNIGGDTNNSRYAAAVDLSNDHPISVTYSNLRASFRR